MGGFKHVFSVLSLSDIVKMRTLYLVKLVSVLSTAVYMALTNTLYVIENMQGDVPLIS